MFELLYTGNGNVYLLIIIVIMAYETKNNITYYYNYLIISH